MVDAHDTPAQLGAEFDKNVEHVPAWNWIFWAPALLGALARPQAALAPAAGPIERRVRCP